MWIIKILNLLLNTAETSYWIYFSFLFLKKKQVRVIYWISLKCCTKTRKISDFLLLFLITDCFCYWLISSAISLICMHGPGPYPAWQMRHDFSVKPLKWKVIFPTGQQKKKKRVFKWTGLIQQNRNDFSNGWARQQKKRKTNNIVHPVWINKTKTKFSNRQIKD